ncbi:MAG: valine--tRNA ligase, partial [Deltaproteobacteria bacterium]|nr:valine--tRNA ligase [Deltaproteobacteria bacterium]
RFTMDEGLSTAVREVFVTLYEEGLIYQGDYIINWCPRCHTALSDLEVEFEEHNDGKLWDLEYPLADGSGSIIVSTTRPETMLGDTAVAVNGADERYCEMIGKEVLLPLMNRRIPIVADDYVDREFGSGAVKITPAHDANDFEVGTRHKLEIIKVMDEAGVMNENAGPYTGLTREACRQQVIADLDQLNLLPATKDYQHNVGHCYRCQTIIEPYLSNQWFVKIKPLADRALAAVKNGDTRIIPQNWEKTYFNWMENIRDWCVSRQIWWGHRIPAWYCEDCGKMIVAREDPDSCPECSCTNLRQETDVLDTWFSSGLWPFSTMGWPESTPTLEKYYPTSVLVTGFDILFFWVARMMMMGLKCMDEIPFKDVYIHALVRDEHGQKMSKSKGNVIDPLIIIDKYGADALRFTLAAFAAQGRDVSLSEARISGYRNFVNKLWNAARFTLMNLEGFSPETKIAGRDLSLAERWISHRLNQTSAEVAAALDEYRFNDAAHVLYQFTWHEFCDWYLELAKPDLFQSDDEVRKTTAQTVLYQTLEQIVRLLHPIMPFVCEEIWQTLPHTRAMPASIMQTTFPQAAAEFEDFKAAAEMEQVMAVITAIRNIRGEMNLSPGQRLAAVVTGPDAAAIKTLQKSSDAIANIARLTSLTIDSKVQRPPQSAAGLASGFEIFVPLKGLIDFAQEAARLAKDLKKTEKEFAGVSKKLGNEKFLGKAPAAVIEKEKGKHQELSLKLEKLKANIKTLEQVTES